MVLRKQGWIGLRVCVLVGLVGMISWGLPRASQADLFVSAAGDNSVWRFDRDTGVFIEKFVTPNAGGLSDPQGIAFGPDGNLYVASNGSNNVLMFNGQSGDFIRVFATRPDMNWPAEITFRGDHLYVSDFSSQFTVGRVSRFNANTGAFVDHFITGASFADGQSWDSNGDLYLSHFGSNSIRKYDGETGVDLGAFVNSSSGGLGGPLDNLFMPNGDFLVSSFNTQSIKRYDSNGVYIDDPITGLTGGPQGLVLGPDGFLYAGDFGRGLINRYDPNTYAFLGTFASTGGLSTTNNFVFRDNAVPEASTFGSMVLVGSLGLGIWVWRRRRMAPRRVSKNHPAKGVEHNPLESSSCI